MTGRVLLAALLLVSPLQSFDDAVRAAVQSHKPHWLDAPMHVATDAAKPALVTALVVALVAGPAGRMLALEAALALAPVNLVVEGMKYVVDRPRPGGGHKRTNAAYPSSHAANAFAAATVLGRRWRRSAPLGFALAAIVAYSRLYLDRHWCTDVLVGAALGVALALAAIEAFEAWRAGREAARREPEAGIR